MGGHDERVVPGQARAGEGGRDAGHGRDHHRFDPGPAQRGDDAEEARVAAGQHHRLAVVRGHPRDHRRYRPHDQAFRAHVQSGQVPLAPGHQRRAGQRRTRGGTEAAAVVADHRHPWHAGRPGPLAATVARLT